MRRSGVFYGGKVCELLAYGISSFSLSFFLLNCMHASI